MSLDVMPPEVVERFRQLTAERLIRAESIWFSLMQGAGAQQDAAELARLVHTLKGDARLVRFAEVDRVCHKLEDLLAVANELVYVVPDDVDLLVTMSFHFIGLLARKPAGVQVAGIDLDGFAREVDHAVAAARAIERTPDDRVEGPSVPPRGAQSSEQGSRLARAAAVAFLEHLGARGPSRQRLHQLWQLLQNEVARLSSATLSDLVERHIASANDLCEQLGKLVDVGADTHGLSVTERVADALDIGLVHCVRNAVDHGLEAPDERVAADKPRRGILRIRARADGDFVELSVEDDGRGFDHEAIARRAREAGLHAPPDAKELLFVPGLSTARDAGSLSGRGVGLDAVRSALGKVGGEVCAQDRPGGGARIVMRVPAAVHRMTVHAFEAHPGIRLAVPTSWALDSDPQPGRAAIDPLEALGLAVRSADPPQHVMLLRRGLMCVCYATATSPEVEMAQRICATASTDPMEVVTVHGHEVLVLRPDRIAGAVGARALL